MFTGSGMPMRFADLDGSMIDVYQAATQMTDESDQTYPFTINSLLDNALGPEGYYGVFTANMHTDSASSSGADAIVASAQARGVPVVSAAPDADVARRPQQLVVQLAVVERQQARLHDRRRCRRERPAGDGADQTRSVGSLTTRQAQRQPDPDYDADDQGRRVRLLRRRRRELRGDLRSRRHRSRDLQRRPMRHTATGRRRSPGTPTSRRTPGSTTAPIPPTSTDHSRAPRSATSHSVQLTGLAPNTTYYYRVSSTDARRQLLDGAAGKPRRREASQPPPRASPTPPPPTSAPGPRTPTPTSPRPGTAR